MKRFALIAVFALVGCRAKEGGSCGAEGAVVCADATTQLVCNAGKYAAVSCKGPEGCHGKDAHCDLSGNANGDKCSSKDEGRKLCSADRKSRLRCENRVIVAEKCPGIGGCTPNPITKAIDCDPGEPVAGQPCDDDRAQCSRDFTHTFECKDGKWAVGRPCRGTHKCSPPGRCDATQAAEGDPCPLKEESRYTCGLENRSIVQCVAGQFKTTSSCPMGKRCVHDQEPPNYPRYSSAQLAYNPRCE